VSLELRKYGVGEYSDSYESGSKASSSVSECGHLLKMMTGYSTSLTSSQYELHLQFTSKSLTRYNGSRSGKSLFEIHDGKVTPESSLSKYTKVSHETVIFRIKSGSYKPLFNKSAPMSMSMSILEIRVKKSPMGNL